MAVRSAIAPPISRQFLLLQEVTRVAIANPRYQVQPGNEVLEPLALRLVGRSPSVQGIVQDVN
ncbi:MAG: hypothetical protein HXY43_08370 [Fischerella sp.]|uniref:hypothetical protein n=1 Tax=Fischerella sp. TaxID=1191 RepID=UPI0017CC9EE6|nr:hypothetical protein [Fischerella sp.]NWF59307.1 hypothetical protein [Fischerella sp.]